MTKILDHLEQLYVSDFDVRPIHGKDYDFIIHLNGKVKAQDGKWVMIEESAKAVQKDFYQVQKTLINRFFVNAVMIARNWEPGDTLELTETLSAKQQQEAYLKENPNDDTHYTREE